MTVTLVTTTALKGVPVTSACAYYFANLLIVPVCLSVHIVTQKHTHTQETLKHMQIHVKK